MLDTLKRKGAAALVMVLLRSLATNKDTQTTIAGLIAGAMLAIPGLDLAQVIAGDPIQIAHLVAGLLVASIGLLATRENRDGRTTLLGTVAGTLYATQGSVESLVTGVVIAVLGYLTNKPTTGAAKPV